MATYQNSSVDSDALILGNYKIETASSSGGSYTNLGAGMLTSFKHTFEKYSVQAGNAPDPIEGIATETCNFAFDLIEFSGSALSALQNGLVSNTYVTASTTIDAGGNQVLTKRAYRLTNTRIIDSSTIETVITVYKGAIDDGMNIVTKSDNDTDPINAFQFSVTGELDTSLSVGSQLFSLVRTNPS